MLKKLLYTDDSVASEGNTGDGSLLSLGQKKVGSVHNCRHRVLVIDDNEDSLLFAQYALELLGYQPISINSGHKALEFALLCSPEIVLLDIRLDGINGFDVLNSFRQNEQTAGVPVIAVTAAVLKRTHKTVLAAGFSGFLAKPYMLEELGSILQYSLSKQTIRA
ncbi:MAG: response regulator [Leptolyngbyaceae cyanobacterium]